MDDDNVVDISPKPNNELPDLVLHEDFGGEDMFNMRDWLQKALEAQGAIKRGAGCGMGEADIDIELEGCKYNVRIKPILNRVKD